jgi:hypothetical protein
MTLRAGWAGAAARHHGPHLRAALGLISIGAREWCKRIGADLVELAPRL